VGGGWALPDVIVELLSSSTAEVDRELRRIFTRGFPDTVTLFLTPCSKFLGDGIWILPLYQPLVPNERGALVSDVGLWLGLGGTIDREAAVWLPFTVAKAILSHYQRKQRSNKFKRLNNGLSRLNNKFKRLNNGLSRVQSLLHLQPTCEKGV